MPSTPRKRGASKTEADVASREPSQASNGSRAGSPGGVKRLSKADRETEVHDATIRGMKVKLQAVGLDPVKPNPLLQNCMFGCVILSWFWTYEVAIRFLKPEEVGEGVVYNYVLASFPIFFFLIGMEWVMYKLGAGAGTTAGWPNSPDSWSSVAAGTMQQAIQPIMKAFIPFTIFYMDSYDKYRLIDLPDNMATMVLAFVAGDFTYYWLHRHAHEYHFLWAGHATHHSSEYYNMWTALRQSWWQAVTGPLWSVPLLLFIPPRCWMVTHQWVTLYQFWIHTCTIRRLWWPIEFIFSTPSAHRVHHDRRVHKNFAGVFILWDRIFGTFQDELQHSATEGGLWHGGDETCFFGIKEQIGTWAEPIIQHERWLAVFSKGITSISTIVKGPGFFSTTMPRPLPIDCPPTVKRLRTPTTHSWPSLVWLWGNYFFCLFLLVSALMKGSSYPLVAHCVTSAFVVFTLTMGGLFLDGRDPTTMILIELVRSALMAGSVYTKFPLVQSQEVCFGYAAANAALVIVFNKSLMGRVIKKKME